MPNDSHVRSRLFSSHTMGKKKRCEYSEERKGSMKNNRTDLPWLMAKLFVLEKFENKINFVLQPLHSEERCAIDCSTVDVAACKCFLPRNAILLTTFFLSFPDPYWWPFKIRHRLAANITIDFHGCALWRPPTAPKPTTMTFIATIISLARSATLTTGNHFKRRAEHVMNRNCVRAGPPESE